MREETRELFHNLTRTFPCNCTLVSFVPKRKNLLNVRFLSSRALRLFYSGKTIPMFLTMCFRPLPSLPLHLQSAIPVPSARSLLQGHFFILFLYHHFVELLQFPCLLLVAVGCSPCTKRKSRLVLNVLS